ncbi:MAG: DUF937 domain-containing protein [Rhizobiales bacterium]|nr:DUF937 domain-containing protein [Hyphomicrobiales bacterium]
MALLDILEQAQGGAFYANAGRAVGILPEEAKTALDALCPAIAVKLRQTAENEETLDALLEIIEDGNGDAFLDDPALISDPEVAKDGNAILADVYGTKTSALKAAQALAPGLDKKALATLTAIAASSVVAALARSQRQSAMMPAIGVQQAAGTGGGGLLGTIVSAVLEGAIKGAVRELTPKPKRRRTSYATARRRRAKTRTRTRRTARPSLDSIFRDILGSIRK